MWPYMKLMVAFNSCHCVKSVQMRSYFWSVFSCIRVEYGDLRSKSPYSIRIQENADRKNLRIWTLFTQCVSLIILYHYLCLVNSPFPYWISTCLEKNPSAKLFFFLKSSHFCAITSISWRIYLQTRLVYNFRFPIWNKIHDRHSCKILNQELYSWSVKCPDWQ